MADIANISKERDEREDICKNLSTISFEELIKLKETVGSKIYNNAVFGSNMRKRKTNFKRANKNRPREISSKLKSVGPEQSQIGKQIPRDPRFDPLCGNYNGTVFHSHYKFLKDIKKREKKVLEKEFKNTDDSKRKEKLKFLIQRIDNQVKEREKKGKEGMQAFEEKKEIKAKLMSGQRPSFKNKSQKKFESLIGKYEDLKMKNKLKKHIEKRSKKLIKKDRKGLNFDV